RRLGGPDGRRDPGRAPAPARREAPRPGRDRLRDHQRDGAQDRGAATEPHGNRIRRGLPPPARARAHGRRGVSLPRAFYLRPARAGHPGCVLIRALEPIAGARAMARRRGQAAASVGLTNGPGKLAEALDVTLRDNGADLTRGRLVIDRPPGPRGFAVGVGPRVGVTRAVGRLLRFWIRGHTYVS